MAYYPQYPGYAPYYTQPMPDQLTQLRQNQMQQPMMQGTQMQTPAMQTQQIPFPQPIDDRIWVQGEGAATSYLVAANGFVRLWDSTAPVFYEKQADAQGKPLPMVIYDYKRRGEEPVQPTTPQIDMSQFITRDELEDILADRLKRPSKSTKSKEDTSNE